MTLDPAIGTLLMLALTVLFGSSAVGKLRAPAHFKAVLYAYRLLPPAPLAVLVWVLPFIEGLTAALLVVHRARAIAALTASGLLLLYAAAIGINLRRGRLDLDCGCTGPGQRRPIGRWMVVRNLTVAAGALLLLLPASGRSLELTDGLSIGAGLAVLLLLWASLDWLLGVVMPRSIGLGGLR